MSNLKKMRAEFDKKLGAFLSQRRRSKGGWAEVSDADMRDLSDLVDLLIDLKSERDPDGDQTIEFRLVNRRTHEGLRFCPIPYSSWKKGEEGASDWEVLDAAHLNLSIAQGRFDTAFKIYGDSKRNE